MTDPIVVLALRRKRDKISGVIAEYENKIKACQHDLAHVVASLRLFKLTGDPSDFPPYIDLNRLLRRGETTRICMAALAKEGPLPMLPAKFPSVSMAQNKGCGGRGV